MLSALVADLFGLIYCVGLAHGASLRFDLCGMGMKKFHPDVLLRTDSRSLSKIDMIIWYCTMVGVQ